MMKRLILLNVLMIFCAALGLKAESHLMYDKANQLYHNKEYEQAAKLYEQMIDDGYCHADLFYNAGNAYYRSNKIGLAIWCFQKAIQHKKDKNYIDNLALAEKRIQEPIVQTKDIFFVRWWNALVSLFTVNGWSLFALIVFLIAMCLKFMGHFKGQFAKGNQIANYLLALSFFSLILMAFSWNESSNHYKAIVIKSTKSFDVSIPLSEGVLVEYVKKGTKGVVIKLPNAIQVEIDPKYLRKL